MRCLQFYMLTPLWTVLSTTPLRHIGVSGGIALLIL